jgi:hypothetical protein
MGRERNSRCQWFAAEEHLKMAGNFRGNLAFQNQDLLVGSISYGRSAILPLARSFSMPYVICGGRLIS